MSQYIVFITQIMSYKRLKSNTLETWQRKDTITPQAIDRGNRSHRNPHRSTLDLLQLLNNNLATLSTLMVDTQQV
jgi:hypothetical protein